jgi:hypothetical protein
LNHYRAGLVQIIVLALVSQIFTVILLEQTGKISLRIHVLQKCKDGIV